MKRSLLLTTIALGLLFASCKKSSYNSSPTPPTVNYQLVATNTSYGVAKTTATSNIVWTSGFANPDVIKFEAKQNNLEVEFKSTNNAQIDLMAPVALTFGDFTLPAGTYDEIELKIDLDKNGTSPALQLNGTFTSGLITLPVVFEIKEPIELTTEQHNVVISTDSSFTAVTTLDLLSMTTGINAAMLLDAQLTNGTIVISQTSNHDIYEMILTNLGHHHHHCEFEHHWKK